MRARFFGVALPVVFLFLPACAHPGPDPGPGGWADGAILERDADVRPELLGCQGYSPASPNYPRVVVALEFVVSEEGIVERDTPRAVSTARPPPPAFVERAKADAEGCWYRPATVAGASVRAVVRESFSYPLPSDG